MIHHEKRPGCQCAFVQRCELKFFRHMNRLRACNFTLAAENALPIVEGEYLLARTNGVAPLL